MAQFVTHIQPTLIEASHHHIPHPHHHKEHHEKHDKHHKELEKQHKEYDKHHKELEKYKEVVEHQQCSKDHSLKEKLSSKIYLPVVGHSTQHYPILPATPSHHHFDEHAEQEHKRDSGQYLDSHGIPHTYHLHFIDSQGIHRDFHGHVEDSQERACEQYLQDEQEKESHYEKKEYYMGTEEVFIRKAVPEDRSPYDKSPFRDDRKPIPPQFINLNAPENKYQTVKNGILKRILSP